MTPRISINRLPNYAEAGPNPSLLSSGRSIPLHSAASDDVELAPRQRVALPTGLSVEIPVGYEGQVVTDTQLAADSGVVVLNSPGTIDADYRGEVMVILYNHSDGAYIVRRGSKIADMHIRMYVKVKLHEVKELSPSSRGAGGLGSTGSA